jgi:hypothetical protein
MSLFLRLLRQSRTPRANIAITPATAPIAIPAIAPLERSLPPEDWLFIAPILPELFVAVGADVVEGDVSGIAPGVVLLGVAFGVASDFVVGVALEVVLGVVLGVVAGVVLSDKLMMVAWRANVVALWSARELMENLGPLIADLYSSA